MSKDTDRKKLLRLLQEAESRGLKISPEQAQALLQIKQPKIWRLSPNGYFYKYDGKEYVPNDKVKPFLESRARYALLSGSRGSGKSAVGAQKALKKIMEGEDGAVINPVFENFKTSTWPEFRNWIPWEMVVPGQRYRQQESWSPQRPFELVFDTGLKMVRVICKGLKDPSGARGPNINWLWGDEFRDDETGEAWQIAVAAVRVGHEPQAWVTTTPAGKDHWLYDFFIDQNIPEDAKIAFLEAGEDRELIETFHATIFDNKDNLDPGYYASMLAAYPSGWLRRQEIFGEFVAKEGSIGVEAAEALRLRIRRDEPLSIVKRVRFWDLAGTEKKIIKGKTVNDPDETVGTLGSFDKTNFFIENQKCGFMSWDKLKEFILETAILDGPGVYQIVEQEPASGGKNQVAELKSFLKDNLPVGFPSLEGWLPRSVGDRVMGANYWFSKAVAGEIFLVDDGSWDLEGFLDQVANFPVMKHDDRVTSTTGAIHSLQPIKGWKRIKFLHL